MRLTLLVIAFLLMLPQLRGQAFLEKIRSGNANFYEVMAEYNAWVNEHGELTKAQGRNEVRRFFRERFFNSDENGNPIDIKSFSPEEYNRLKSARKSQLKSAQAGPVWTSFGPNKVDLSNSNGYCPGSAVIRSVITQPGNSNVIYAGSVSAGIWKTIDGGQNWKCLTPNEPVREINSLAVAYNNTSLVLAGANNFGLMRSYDGGQNWELTTLSKSEKSVASIWSIQIDPADDDHIVAGTSSGVLTSFDGGNTWDQPVVSGHVKDLAIHPTDGNIIYALNINSSSRLELLKSTDGGKTFTEKTTGLPNKTNYGSSTAGKLAVTPAAADNVYVLIAGQYNGGSGLVGVYTSDDKGETFQFQCCGNQPGGTPSASNKNMLGYSDQGTEEGGQWTWDLAFEVSKTNAQKVYVGGIILWVSSDKGKNFSCFSPWYKTGKDDSKFVHCDIQDMYDAGDKLLLTSDGGIYVSVDHGASFANITHGISGTETWSPAGLSRINPNIAVMGTYHNGILYVFDEQTPEGWINTFGGDAQLGNVNLLDHIYSNDGGGTTQVSNDGGQTWSAFGKKGLNFEISPGCINHITGVAKGNFYQSLDGGGSFTEVYTTNQEGGYTYEHGQVAYARSNPDVIYGTFQYGRNMVKSTDGGQTWKKISLPYSGMRVFDIDVDPEDENKVYITNLGWRSGDNVFCSVDGGQSWTDFSEGLAGLSALSLKCQAGTDGGIYLGTQENGVYYRNNTLGKWVEYNGNLPLKTRVIGLHINYVHNKLFITSEGRGIWTTDLYESSNRPSAGFSADRTKMYLPGENIQFYENAYYSNSDVSYQWTFPGGTPASSTDASPVISYNSPGEYDVTLEVTDQAGTHTTTLTKFIILSDKLKQGIQEEAGTALKLTKNGNAAVKAFDKNLSSMTMTCWIKSAGTQDPFAGVLFHRGSQGSAAGLNFRENNELGYHWNDNFWSWSSGATVQNNQWNFVALVVEPSRTTLYLNDKAYTNAAAHGANLFDGPLKIGADHAETREFNGLIDEVKIWDRALTSAEIEKQKYITSSQDDHLLAYYQFNQTLPSFVYDGNSLYHGSKPTDMQRVLSSAPVAGGVHVSSQVNNTMTQFEETGIALQANAGSPTWKVNRLNATPVAMDGIPTQATVTPCYWILESTDEATAMNVQLSVSDEMAAQVDEFSGFSLYGRSFNGEGNWRKVKGNGVFSADNNIVLFEEVTHEGQLILVKEQGTGLTEQEAARIRLWPNPATSQITIDWPKSEELTYQIFDASGQIIYFGKNNGRQTFTISFSNIASGNYFIRLSDGKGYAITKRFVVK